MDENAFKKHLRDLVHGHHHPEEHDWGTAGAAAAPAKPAKKTRAARPKSRSAKRRSK